MSLSLMAFQDLLDALASNQPVPGGGSASALAGAVGVSLLVMVAGLPKTRTGTPEGEADLAEAAARLRKIRDALVPLMDADSEAYQAVLDAMRLPSATDAEKQARRDAVQRALRAATEVPMETMRECQQALRGALVVAMHGNPNAATDTGVAIELLRAALLGAAMNVRVNAKSLADHAFVERVLTECGQLEADAQADAAKARGLLPLT
jgi:formiminotetrahydrofolate cyclodeaminase